MRSSPPNRIAARLALLALLGGAPAWAGVASYLAPEALAERSVAAVEARVEAVRSGFDPETGRLATYVELEDIVWYRGEPRDGAAPDRLILREAGGARDGRVLVVDAAPRYVPGERVFVFLAAAADGTLRTAGHFFGKLEAASDGGWTRDLRGAVPQGKALLDGPERFRAGDVEALALTARRSGAPRPWRVEPAEWPRLEFGPAPAEPEGPSLPVGRFAPHSFTHPARWIEADAGVPVRFVVDPAGNPLGDAGEALQAVARAAQAWQGVGASRLAVEVAPHPVAWAAAHPASPGQVYQPGANVVLFGDPWDEIEDPAGCAGVVAIGGYWRGAEPACTVNDVSYYPMLQAWVVFNDGFECFLDDAANVSEVAAHEIGHGLGFGHSSDPDAIMRAVPFGGRGAVLGDDDRDAAHCHYPHELDLRRPAAGDRWVAGTELEVRWTSSAAGAEPTDVEIQLSADGGQTWQPLASDVADDGAWTWTLPEAPLADARLRVVRPHASDATWALKNGYCSGDATAGSFRVVEPPRHHRRWRGARDRVAEGAANPPR